MPPQKGYEGGTDVQLTSFRMWDRAISHDVDVESLIMGNMNITV